MRTRRFAALAAGLALAAPTAPAGAEGLEALGAAVLAAMDADQRDACTWAFDDGEREDVHYAPIGLDGVAHGDLDDAASAAVDALLRAALSPRGYAAVRDVRELELAVREKEKGRFWSFATGWMRDPGRYLLAFFGDPSAAAPWGFRYEGHHLSLNVTAAPGSAPATTPLFLGAEPRVVPAGWPSGGIAVLGEEERLARELHAALAPELRERATLTLEDGRGLLLGEVSRVEPVAPVGVPRGDMSPAQQALLDALVERFVGLFPVPTAAASRARIDAAGRDAVHFAFAAGDDPPDAYYVRVQGPLLLIEIDNTSDGDHVHAVWHDLADDFGDGILARHLREAHGQARLARAEGR